jgi:hypothetical protein
MAKIERIPNSSFPEIRKTKYDVTVITRMKSTFKYQILEESHVEQSAVNENIVSDRKIRV